MPGRIASVHVDEGERVTAGQVLIKLEAMKMEHSLIAPFDGIVTALSALADTQVAEGHVLMTITADATDDLT